MTESYAVCAHLRINYRTVESEPGHVVKAWWECKECLLRFVPESFTVAMSEPTSTAASETAEQVARPIAKWFLTTGGPTTIEDITGRIADALREATAPLQAALAEMKTNWENEHHRADDLDEQLAALLAPGKPEGTVAEQAYKVAGEWLDAHSIIFASNPEMRLFVIGLLASYSASRDREIEQLKADSEDYFDLLRAKESAERDLAALQELNKLREALLSHPIAEKS